MKKIENSFCVSGFIGQDATIREFQNASVARFSLAVSHGEKDKEGKVQYTSAFVNLEAWRKNEAKSSFDILKKGTLITCQGYLRPETWTGEDGKERNRINWVVTKFYPAEEIEQGKKG